jgi:hypothetical protein
MPSFASAQAEVGSEMMPQGGERHKECLHHQIPRIKDFPSEHSAEGREQNSTTMPPTKSVTPTGINIAGSSGGRNKNFFMIFAIQTARRPPPEPTLTTSLVEASLPPPSSRLHRGKTRAKMPIFCQLHCHPCSQRR